MIYVYNVDEMAPELMEKTVEELDQIDEEMKSWRHLRGRSARGKQVELRQRPEPAAGFPEASHLLRAAAGYAEGGSGGTPASAPVPNGPGGPGGPPSPVHELISQRRATS